MNADTGKKVGTLVRALAFSRAHPDETTGYQNMLDRLEAGIRRAEAELERYRAGRLTYAAGVERRKDLKAMIRRRYLKPMAQVAKTAFAGNPDAVRAVTPPEYGSGFEEFRAAAHGAAAAAEKYQAALVAHGVGPTFVAELNASLAEYDAAVDTINAGRREHVGATSTLRLVLAECMQLLQLFDGVNSYRFAQQPEMLAAWKSARNVPWERNGRGGEADGEAGEQEVPRP